MQGPLRRALVHPYPFLMMKPQSLMPPSRAGSLRPRSCLVNGWRSGSRRRGDWLRLQKGFAGRLDELPRDSAAGPAARRLGIHLWHDHAWTKTIGRS